jgi:hypothetical protein
MKTFNKTLIAAATLTTSYLWRGLELGDGDAALAVDLSDSMGAVSYGLWVSSGDSTSTEYDLYASYGGSFGEIGYSIGYASYNYPTTNVGFDDAAEYIYGLSYGPASVTVYDEKDGEGEYTVFGYEAGAYSFAYGDHEVPDLQHFDVSYAVNDSLSVTVSKMDDADTTVVASYSLPF